MIVYKDGSKGKLLIRVPRAQAASLFSRAAPAAVLALAACGQGALFAAPSVGVNAKGQYFFPLFTEKVARSDGTIVDLFDKGVGGIGTVDFLVDGRFGGYLQADYLYVTSPKREDEARSLTVNLFSVDVGPEYRFRLNDRIDLRAGVAGGLYNAVWDQADPKGGSCSGIDASAKIEADWRITPSISASAFASYHYFAYNPEPFLQGAAAGISLSVDIVSLLSGKANMSGSMKKQDQLFPVFFSYYDDNAFGQFTLANDEANAITDVKASFMLDQYMSQPKACATVKSVPKGGKVDVPLKAFFNESIMELTENVDAEARVIVEYKSLGEPRKTSIPVTLPVNHRNAMNWTDDRRAAAFASSKDPAALWLSKWVASIVSERMRKSVNTNMQYGIGLFETLKVFGLSYVVDPASAYASRAEGDEAVDFLQYPYQTIQYRGGDCDDLSILYCSLFEAIGIETAFITIPGHIYMAFSLGMTEDEAKLEFYDSGNLIYREGKAWVPLEITITKENFNKAWRIGAKEWNDNDAKGLAKFYPVREAWKTYKPVSVPGAVSRFTLPSRELAVASFDKTLDAYVEREIRPQIREFETALAKNDDPATRNLYGLMLGKYGLLDDAETQFSLAAARGDVHALANLGNISFSRDDFETSLSRYDAALKKNPDDAGSLLGVARSYYELEDFSKSDEVYARVCELDPVLASKYSYLASFFDTQGRAWNLSDRLYSVPWSYPDKTKEAQILERAEIDAAPVMAVIAKAPSLSETKVDIDSGAGQARDAVVIVPRPGRVSDAASASNSGTASSSSATAAPGLAPAPESRSTKVSGLSSEIAYGQVNKVNRPYVPGERKLRDEADAKAIAKMEADEKKAKLEAFKPAARPRSTAVSTEKTEIAAAVMPADTEFLEQTASPSSSPETMDNSTTRATINDIKDADSAQPGRNAAKHGESAASPAPAHVVDPVGVGVTVPREAAAPSSAPAIVTRRVITDEGKAVERVETPIAVVENATRNTRGNPNGKSADPGANIAKREESDSSPVPAGAADPARAETAVAAVTRTVERRKPAHTPSLEPLEPTVSSSAASVVATKTGLASARALEKSNQPGTVDHPEPVSLNDAESTVSGQPASNRYKLPETRTGDDKAVLPLEALEASELSDSPDSPGVSDVSDAPAAPAAASPAPAALAAELAAATSAPAEPATDSHVGEARADDNGVKKRIFILVASAIAVIGTALSLNRLRGRKREDDGNGKGA